MSFIRENLPSPIEYFEAEGLKLVGKGKWRTTNCTFHGGSDSMHIDTEPLQGGAMSNSETSCFTTAPWNPVVTALSKYTHSFCFWVLRK